jgi:hypothetical protein
MPPSLLMFAFRVQISCSSIFDYGSVLIPARIISNCSAFMEVAVSRVSPSFL